VHRRAFLSTMAGSLLAAPVNVLTAQLLLRADEIIQ
jgi:hypothetical protein